LFNLFFEALGHSDELHGVEFIKSLFIEHDRSFRSCYRTMGDSFS
jgi:hypothetical protein